MSNPLDFGGRVVLVTGGGKGIGRGISESFLAAGAQVVICGRSQPEQLPGASGREATFVACDVRDYGQIEACTEQLLARFGRLDVLVNNAGGAPRADAAACTLPASHHLLDLELVGSLGLCPDRHFGFCRQPCAGCPPSPRFAGRARQIHAA